MLCSCQTLSAFMLILMLSFGVIWVVAMFSGVAKTVKRRQEVRRSKFLSGTTPSSRWIACPEPTLLLPHMAVSSSGVTAEVANFDHPGDSVFTATVEDAVGDDDRTRAVEREGAPGDVASEKLGVETSVVNPLRAFHEAATDSSKGGRAVTGVQPPPPPDVHAQGSSAVPVASTLRFAVGSALRSR